MVAQWKNINDRYKNIEGYKRVAWPPANEERVVREFTPQPHGQYAAPTYNPQAQEQQHQQQPPQSQQYQPSAAPPTQGKFYNNVHHNQYHHHYQNQPHTPYYNSTNNTSNNHARESISPYHHQMHQDQDLPEPFPPQTPETPIVLVDKQFSRLPSQEPMHLNKSGTYDDGSSSKAGAASSEWQKPRENQPPTFNQPCQYYQQQYQTPRYQQHPQQQQQQHQHQPQYQPQQRETTPGGCWNKVDQPQSKHDFPYTKPAGDVGRDESTASPQPIYQRQFESYHKQQQQQEQQQTYFQTQQQYQQQQQQYQPPKQYSPQPQYQASAPGQNQYQYQPQQQQQPHHQPWTQEQHLPQPYKPPSQQSQYQAPQQPSPYQQQQYQQPGYQAPMNNQYQQPQQQQQNQFISQTNQQQQFNSYSQPQQMQNAPTHGQDQHDHLIQGHDQRGASPGIITLRKEAPISQAPAPVYTSQPAAVSFQGGNKLRGDMKWPPQEYKEAAARENEERRKLALGPVCRPRKVARDYTDFFAKNALSHHYPSYKVPPGTQHMTY